MRISRHARSPSARVLAHGCRHTCCCLLLEPIIDHCNCATTPNPMANVPCCQYRFRFHCASHFVLLISSWVTLVRLSPIIKCFLLVRHLKALQCSSQFVAKYAWVNARAYLCRWSAMKLIASMKYFKIFYTHFLSHSTGNTKIRLSRKICLIQTLSA